MTDSSSPLIFIVMVDLFWLTLTVRLNNWCVSKHITHFKILLLNFRSDIYEPYCKYNKSFMEEIFFVNCIVLPAYVSPSLFLDVMQYSVDANGPHDFPVKSAIDMHVRSVTKIYMYIVHPR